MKHPYKTLLVMAALILFTSGSVFAMGQRLPSSSGSSSSGNSSSGSSGSSSGSTTSGDVTPLWEAKVSGSKAWTTFLNTELDRLGTEMLDVIPADSATFCPNYKNLSYDQRKQFWIFLMSAMVRYESNFNTNTTYTESFADSSGNRVVSRGLLQISIESGNAYGCGFKASSDLHDPQKNLSCGVRILDRWVGRDGRIAGNVGGWKGGARYWSVLRTSNSGPYNSIVGLAKGISICK